MICHNISFIIGNNLVQNTQSCTVPYKNIQITSFHWTIEFNRFATAIMSYNPRLIAGFIIITGIPQKIA